jgi:hypothetical protein
MAKTSHMGWIKVTLESTGALRGPALPGDFSWVGATAKLLVVSARTTKALISHCINS